MNTVFSKKGLPFLPSDRPRPALQFTRAAFANAVAATSLRSAADIAKERWPSDEATLMVMRGVASPATIASSPWAGVLAPTVTGDYVATLAPVSAAAAVFARAIVAPLDGVASITVPRRANPPDPADVSWIAPGEPIGVGQLTVTGTILTPKKLATIVAATRELIESSAAEAVFNAILRENVATSLDATFFSEVSATDARPAGVLEGITALTAASGADAMIDDLAQLVAAVSGSAGDVMIVANTAQALAIRVRLGSNFDVQVVGSRSVPAGTVIALDPAAIAVGFGAVPRFESSQETVLHMNTVPTAISAAGSPNTIAAPVRSLFQTDCIATRVLLPAAWAVRDASAIAWVEGVSW